MLAVDVSNWLQPDATTSLRRTYWTAALDAVRLGPDDDDIAVTAARVRDVITPADRRRAAAQG
jgi:hypothetical protein